MYIDGQTDRQTDRSKKASIDVHDVGGACSGPSRCAYVRLWVFSDLSRNNFTKISVEAAPLLATLYRPKPPFVRTGPHHMDSV